jgi:uncharacterized membrane protein
METQTPHTPKTVSGLDENVAGALAYTLGWITGLFFYFTETENKFVRFHAMQSTVVFGAASVIWFVLLAIPILGFLLDVFVIMPASFVLWLLLMYKAYNRERFKLPIAGEIAEQQI